MRSQLRVHDGVDQWSVLSSSMIEKAYGRYGGHGRRWMFDSNRSSDCPTRPKSQMRNQQDKYQGIYGEYSHNLLSRYGTPILPPEATPYARQTLRPVVVPRVFPTFSDGIPTLDLLINYVERATGAHGVVARIVLTVRRRKVRNWRKERGASEEYISI